MPSSFGTYIEPFIGGGAVFFSLTGRQLDAAVISDANSELVNAYAVVRDEPHSLIEHLQGHQNTKEHYLAVREMDRHADFATACRIERASRFVYLNKTCFNGLHRVNGKGHFNVPFGKYRNPTIADADTILACSRALQGALIMNEDFEGLIEYVDEDSFVYLDPPYVPASATSDFTSYTSGGFGCADQERLRDFCDRITERGGRFMLSNSAVSQVYDLYSNYVIEKIAAPRAISARADGRGTVSEVLVRNYR